jgi:hypothetical protein
VTDDVHSPTTAAPMPPPPPAGGATEAPPPPASGEPSGPQQLAAGAKKALDGASGKPEALVGAAFAGGLVVALVLKRVTRG